jgi:malonyl-CoA/methylmalonyl-CoA synthetase
MKIVDREKLKTGRSIYEHWLDNVKVTPKAVSQSYYGAETTFAEDLKKIDNFVRSINKLNQDPNSTVAFSLLAHPVSLVGLMAQNKQGRQASFINPTVIRANPDLALDKLQTETVFISEPFYHTAKEGLARSSVKNIVFVPLTEGAVDEAGLITDVRVHKGGIVKTLPASLILKSLRKGYKSLKKPDLIPGVSYYNYDEFMAASQGDKSRVPNTPRPNHPTLYLHTSGTTGEPKIVPKSDDNFTLSHNAYMSVDGLNARKDDINGNFYPLFPTTMMQAALTTWVIGIRQAWNPLAAFNGRFARSVFDQRITVATANTQAWRTFLSTELEDGRMSFLRIPFGGGEYMDLRAAQEINQRLRELGAQNPLVLAYGSSEMNPGTHFAVKSFSDYNPERANVVGRGIGGVETRVVGPNGRKLPRGQRGLVEIKPSSKPFPYLGREGEWSEKWTKSGFYKTGDVGEMDEAGHLHVHGREKDRFIGRDGKAYYLFDVNRVLNENPNTLRVIPVELSYRVKGKAGGIVAYIQLKPNRANKMEAVLRDLTAQAKADLKLAARPLAYRFIKAFPIDGSTKTDLKTLAKQRQGFYAIEKDKVVQVSFSTNGEIVKKPTSKVKLSTKL